MTLDRRYSRLAAQLGFVLILIGLSAGGCLGNAAIDNLPRQPVAGLVLLDGRPLPRGSILFFAGHHPVFGTAVAAGTLIQNGRFSIPGDKGLVPGRYRIAISEIGPHHDHLAPLNPEFVADEAIPNRFNIQTELEVEVKEGGIKQLKIEVDSK